MRGVQRAAVALLCLILPLTCVAAGTCTVHAPVHLQLDLKGIRRVEWRQQASDLQLRGMAAGSGLQLTGQACGSGTSALQPLRITPHREGALLVLQVGEAVADPRPAPPVRHAAWQHLRLGLPARVGLRIVSGSGAVSLDRLRGLEVDSISGDITASHINGPLTLRLGSGQATVTTVRGRVTADAGTGDLRIRDVDGLRIGQLGAGTVDASGLRGGVDIDQAGSGTVSLTGTGGGVRIGRAGAADIHMRQIGGPVVIGRGGAGDLLAERVKGSLTVEHLGSGDLEADGISGDLRVRAEGTGRVSERQVRGRVMLTGPS